MEFIEPRDLGGGLTLRHAIPSDATTLHRFNAGTHYETLGQSVEQMVAGQYPNIDASDFLLVEDVNENKIVASGSILSHTFQYANVSFEVGYLENIGTDPAYRRRGLMRTIIEALHEVSNAKNQLVQMVGGVR